MYLYIKNIYFIGLNIYIYFKQYCCDESRELEPSTCDNKQTIIQIQTIQTVIF